MKAKGFVALQTVFLGLGMLVFIPTANPTATGKPGSTRPSNIENHPLSTTRTPAPPGQMKALAVWECTTSWYGDDFDGQPTANGETYDMYADTSAHPTLPLGWAVRVV